MSTLTADTESALARHLGEQGHAVEQMLALYENERQAIIGSDFKSIDTLRIRMPNLVDAMERLERDGVLLRALASRELGFENSLLDMSQISQRSGNQVLQSALQSLRDLVARLASYAQQIQMLLNESIERIHETLDFIEVVDPAAAPTSRAKAAPLGVHAK